MMMDDHVENDLRHAGCTEEEIQGIKEKIGENHSLFSSLVMACVQIQQKGIPKREMQLAWKVAEGIRKEEMSEQARNAYEQK